MKQNSKFFDDIKKIAASTFVTLANMKDEVSSIVKSQVNAMLKNMDVITRKEFEATKKIAADTRKELDDLKHKGGTVMKKPSKKPAAKKAVKKPAAKKAKAKK